MRKKEKMFLFAICILLITSNLARNATATEDDTTDEEEPTTVDIPSPVDLPETPEEVIADPWAAFGFSSDENILMAVQERLAEGIATFFSMLGMPNQLEGLFPLLEVPEGDAT